ncbi:MAG: RNA polymerase factor sigma-32 [Nitratireductor sp.]|nr:RNA polymerase factor sigma-32 [Nitratireductor sp.]
MHYQEYPSQLILKAASSAPYLERDEELALARRWADKKDQDALHQLTTAHMRLVLSLAFKFRRYGLPTADLIQEGHIGLLEAAARFEPEREVRFSTYATWWIKASMQDYILRNWSIVRGGTSSNQKSLFFNLRKVRAQIARSGTASNSQELYEQLAHALKVPVKDVATMDARFSGPDTSLNAPIGEDGEGTAQRMDLLESEEATPQENVTLLIDGERENGWLYEAVDTLNDREKRIIEARRLAEKAATLEELGDEMGISKERVRQIEARALEKLREALLDLNPEFSEYGHL